MGHKNTGIRIIDNQIKGIPGDDFSVVESNSFRSGLGFLAHFIFSGLVENEYCIFVTHIPEKYFLKNMEELGMKLKPYLRSGQLVLLNYSPNIKTDVSLTANFSEVFSELYRLAGTQKVGRIAFHQFDSLLNLSSSFLINSFTHKFSAVCRSVLTADTAVLCEFENFKDNTHTDLAISLQKIAAGYYKLYQLDPKEWARVSFEVVKQPWFDFSNQAFEINLSENLRSTIRELKIA